MIAWIWPESNGRHILWGLGKTETMEVILMKNRKFFPGLLPGFVPPRGEIETDSQGSYTGVPEQKEEQPVQDADDL